MRVFAPTFHEIQLCHSRFSLRYSWAFLFYHMANRYQKQGAIKKLSKLLLRLLILDSFPAISEDFKSIFAFKRPLKNPMLGKGAHKLQFSI